MSLLPASVSVIKKSDCVDVLVIDNEQASATVSLWGAQVLSFMPKQDARERLFTSPKALYDGSKSIRAGVPICWPWFGASKKGLQSHGYIRTRDWQVVSAEDEPGYTTLILQPLSCSGEGFDGEAELLLTLKIGQQLSIELSTNNVGSKAFELSTALHTYFVVEDINETSLEGLSGSYLDKPLGFANLETPAQYRFTQEVDRIHLNPVKQVTIVEPSHSTAVISEGHDSIVVWNPWQAISASLRDMETDSYQKMLCVETAVTQGMQLQPGERHSLVQVIG